ncbi:reverse transcriptase domain-containing protein [Tanacetum coccineum]
MPTWCHMFNSTLTGSARVWFYDLPPGSIDSYDDLKKAFLVNYLQQKKCIKDPIEIHHIKEREGESTEDFMKRFKAKSRHIKGASLCMRISGFMHGITNPAHQASVRQYPKANRNDTGNHSFPQGRSGSFQSRMKESTYGMEATGRDEDGMEGLMIIEAEIGGHFIHRIYVDGGSALEILYEHCFNRLRPEVKNQMVPATAPLIGFSREIIWPMGQILLPVNIGDVEHFTSTWINYVVVRSPSLYNGIIVRPRVRKIQAAVEERIRVAIHPDYPEQTIIVGSTLTEEGRKALCDLLRRRLDVFAWKPADMIGVP